MKRILLFAIFSLCFLTTATAFAQTTDNQVLASGNPPLTRDMVDKSRNVFEFAFGGALTDNERLTYQTELIKAWKNQDAGTIKAVQDLVGLQEKANSLTNEQIFALQKQMQQPLVDELRSQADKDSLAKLLVNAFDRIQGLNAKQGANLPPPDEASQTGNAQNSSGQVPREIVGEWIESHSSGTTYTNGYGGYSSPSAEKVIMHFNANGTYSAAYYVQSSMSVGCAMTVYMPSTGVYGLEGSVLKMTEKSSRTISKDSCNARYNYEKNNQVGSYAYPARFARDENGTKLVLTMGDGVHDFYFNSGKSFISN
ncbi:MAG TPA: hypothetical protein VGC76_05515 [Pyrinomonadaceae bacterium]|jgi:hypothetical protein